LRKTEREGEKSGVKTKQYQTPL